MKIKHYISPRACGKTTFAENLQMEDPENILLFKMDRGYWKWGQNMRGERWKKIIMDEYILRYNFLGETDKDRFIGWIYQVVLNTLSEDGELILISTPDKLYSQAEIALACLGKLDIKFGKFIDVNRINNITNEINNKFLNPSFQNLEIIQTNFGNKKTEEEKKEYKELFSEYQYKADILGMFIKD